MTTQKVYEIVYGKKVLETIYADSTEDAENYAQCKIRAKEV